MDWWVYPAVVVAGLACGFINVLAGSGSLITLPLLIFLGLPAGVANGTNRVAILLQNAVAVRSFHKQKVLDARHGVRLLVPALIGAFLGARLAVNLDERMMRLTIGAIMVIMFFLILYKPSRWLEGAAKDREKPGLMELGAFFLIGVYGGFIQAGVGIFLLAGLVLVSGYDLVRANAVKVLIVLGFTPMALLVFVMADQVMWSIGLIMALGNMSGAWLAGKVAVEKGAPLVRKILLAVVAVSAAKLFYDVIQLSG
ncbi:MAG: sulfite exporter TauE/SafE family protein [Acidobacteriota bacterium]|nr:sulfite exporter TauE/SafE family protein [Acidobacteriota bacterium]